MKFLVLAVSALVLLVKADEEHTTTVTVTETLSKTLRPRTVKSTVTVTETEQVSTCTGVPGSKNYPSQAASGKSEKNANINSACPLMAELQKSIVTPDGSNFTYVLTQELTKNYEGANACQILGGQLTTIDTEVQLAYLGSQVCNMVWYNSMLTTPGECSALMPGGNVTVPAQGCATLLQSLCKVPNSNAYAKAAADSDSQTTAYPIPTETLVQPPMPQMTVQPQPTAPTSLPAGCPAAGVPQVSIDTPTGSKVTYQLSQEFATANQGASACQVLGGQLATVDDSDVQKALGAQLCEKVFFTTSKSLPYTCLALYPRGDTAIPIGACGAKLQALCEIRPKPAMTTAEANLGGVDEPTMISIPTETLVQPQMPSMTVQPEPTLPTVMPEGCPAAGSPQVSIKSPEGANFTYTLTQDFTSNKQGASGCQALGGELTAFATLEEQNFVGAQLCEKMWYHSAESNMGQCMALYPGGNKAIPKFACGAQLQSLCTIANKESTQ